MTADSNGACYSLVKGYKPTVGYQVATGYNNEYGLSKYTYTESTGTAIETRYVEVPTTTIYETDTYTASFDRADRSRYSAFSWAPMITMLHHESDLQSASASSSATAATTSNAAGRISARASVWDGFGSVLGIWAAASALGAAIIFT